MINSLQTMSCASCYKDNKGQYKCKAILNSAVAWRIPLRHHVSSSVRWNRSGWVMEQYHYARQHGTIRQQTVMKMSHLLLHSPQRVLYFGHVTNLAKLCSDHSADFESTSRWRIVNPTYSMLGGRSGISSPSYSGAAVKLSIIATDASEFRWYGIRGAAVYIVN